MVKVVKVAPMGVPDIVKFSDLVGGSGASSTAPAAVPEPVSAFGAARDAVNGIDQWINLADKGISMLGRVDSILSRVQTLQGRGPGPAPVPHGPAPVQPIAAAPPDMMVNADPAYAAPAPADPAPVPVPVETLPARGQAPQVPVGVIIQALDTVERMQPGITVLQLSDSIKRNPDQVQRLLDVFAAGVGNANQHS